MASTSAWPTPASAAAARSGWPTRRHFEKVIEVNLFGVYRTVHACLPHVIERRGYILVVASAAALVHAPGMAAYATSKAGAEAFANSLRQEVHHHGVGVGVGYFSWIDTDLVRGADAHPALKGRRDRLPSFARKTYPVSAVGDAVLEGVESRARSIFVPGWVRVDEGAARRSVRRWPSATRSSSGPTTRPRSSATWPSAARRPRPGPWAPAARPMPRPSAPQRRLEVLHRGEHLLHGGLRVAEQQRGVLVVEERVVDPREARCSSSA